MRCILSICVYDDDAKRVLSDNLQNSLSDLWAASELSTLFFEVTEVCNLHCAHCGSRCASEGFDGVPTDRLLSILSDVVERLGVKPFVNITGGEPLLRSDLFKLGAGIRERGCLWGMTTNGTFIGSGIASCLVDAGCVSVTVSLDGLESSHDALRGVDGSWKRALRGVKNLINAGMRRTDVLTVVHAGNFDELPELFDLLCGIDIDSWRVAFVDPMGRALDGGLQLLDYEQRWKLVDWVASLRRDSYPVSFSCPHFLCDREFDVRNWGFRCLSGIKVASIAANGDILGCLDCERVPETVFGNVYEDDFVDVWKHGFATYRDKREILPDGCKSCEHVDRCIGGSMHTFDFGKREQRVCMFLEHVVS